MASVRAVSQNDSNPVNTLSVTAPTGTTTGDIVVVLASRNAANSGDTIVDNNGGTPFTLARSDHDNTTGAHMSIHYRRIQGGDPSSYSFTFAGDTGATRMTLIAVCIQDPDPSTVFDVTPGAGTLSSSGADSGTINAADITTTVANSVHIIASIRESGNYSNTPSTYTQTNNSGYSQVGFRGWYKVIAVAGATGAQTLTGTGSFSSRVQSFAIKGAAASSQAALLGGKLIGKLEGKL